MKITETLRIEHAAFGSVIEQIERACPQTETLHELQLLADLLRSLVSRHEKKETDLLYVAYDHILAERGELERMSQDHAEFEQLLLRVVSAKDVAHGQRRLRHALSRIKTHFRFEEGRVFPAIEETLSEEALETLAQVS